MVSKKHEEDRIEALTKRRTSVLMGASQSDKFSSPVFYSILFFIFLFSISFISAVPPVTTVQSFGEGYNIEPAPQEFIKQNTDYQLNFFVYNISNGKEISNTSASCIFYMANSQGNVLTYNNVPYQPAGYWGLKINAGNFTNIGLQPYGIKCNSSTKGGATVLYWDVTPQGVNGNSNIVFFIFIILILYAITFVGFFGKNIPITILGGMSMLALGLYLIDNGIIIYRDWLTNYFSYLTLGIGGLLALWAIIEWIQDTMN